MIKTIPAPAAAAAASPSALTKLIQAVTIITINGTIFILARINENFQLIIH